MKISSGPVRGTRDYLPKEEEIRSYLRNKILETYRASGFQQISTPMMESIERLNKSEGGENLSLIFKILKRGEKLDLEHARDENDLVDSGLRYDLTLPLSRYFSNHMNELRFPFKVIQIDRVFRAEKPQKGRLREFYQCDIDIIGDETTNAEIELIHVTAKALLNLGFDEFIIRVNDRRILHDIILGAGFAEEHVGTVCITFDKLDKIGIEGVRAELLGKGFPEELVTRFIQIVSDDSLSLEDIKKFCSNGQYVEDLQHVLESVEQIARGRYKVQYDKSLVRGMGYYTGMVFEIVSPRFSSSVGGGGRYDNMIGKFLNQTVPAVGFSIGFERIAAILQDGGYEVPGNEKQVAVLYGETTVVQALEKSDELQKEGYRVAVQKMGKKLGKQLDKLEKEGFCGAYILDRDEWKMFLKEE